MSILDQFVELKDQNFSYFTEINPALDDSEKVEISNSLLRKRYRVSKDLINNVLLSYLQGKQFSNSYIEKLKDYELVGESDFERAHSQDIEHWEKRNWTDAMDYYLWSKRAEYFDSGEDYSSKRKIALESFLEQSGHPPTPKRIEDGGEELKGILPLPSIEIGKVMFKRANVIKYKNEKTPVDKDVFSSLLWHGFKNVRAVFCNLKG